MRNHGARLFAAIISSSLALAASACSNGFHVVRTAANVDVVPGSIAVLHEPAPTENHAAFAQGFSDELARILPEYTIVQPGASRYRLHVRDVELRAGTDQTQGQARLALRDQDGELIDLVEVRATGPDATETGETAARQFARFLAEREHHDW